MKVYYDNELCMRNYNHQDLDDVWDELVEWLRDRADDESRTMQFDRSKMTVEYTRRNQANTNRNKELKNLKVTVSGIEFDADEASQERIGRALLSSKTTFQWICADDVTRTLTNDQLQAVLDAAIEATEEIISRYNTAKQPENMAEYGT